MVHMKPRLATLVHWINERWSIHRAKESGKRPPWTMDKILAQYRFCNVHRENDKVTRWLKQNWRDPYAKHPDLLGAMVLARMLNRIETLEYIEFPHHGFVLTFKRLQDWREMGNKVFSAAYLITTCGVKMDKLDYVERVVMDACKLPGQTIPGWTCEQYHRVLMTVMGLGTFLAAQVIADLKNTPGHQLSKAKDFSTWAAMGPGSRRGLKALREEDGYDYREREALQHMAEYWRRVAPNLNHMPPIDMQDFQSCLCEFSKYLRTKEGRGTPKQLYRPEV